MGPASKWPAAGELHSLALLADGRVVTWGNDSFGQLDVPLSLRGVSAASSGYYHGLAIVPPMLNFGMTDGGMKLWWSGDYLLQKSASPAGPFEDMTVTSPCTNVCSPGTALQFFRLRTALRSARTDSDGCLPSGSPAHRDLYRAAIPRRTRNAPGGAARISCSPPQTICPNRPACSASNRMGRRAC